MEKVKEVVYATELGEVIYWINNIPYQLRIIYHREGNAASIKTELQPLRKISENISD